MKFKYYVHKIGIFDTNIFESGLKYNGNYYYTFDEAKQELYSEMKNFYPLQKIIEIIPDENGELFDKNKYKFIVHGFSLMPENICRYGTSYPKEKCLSQLVPHVYDTYNDAKFNSINKNDCVFIISLMKK